MAAASRAVAQDGSQLRLSEADRKALVFGLALHEKGKASLEAGSVQVWAAAAAASILLQGHCCKGTVSTLSSRQCTQAANSSIDIGLAAATASQANTMPLLYDTLHST